MDKVDFSNYRYKELDALRGLAVLFVVFFHFTMNYKEYKLGFNLGNTGVDLFFMISGFVIFMTISKINAGREFIISRFSRLYPAYWFCVSVTFLLQIINSTNFLEYFVSNINKYFINMTMLQHFFKVTNIDGPYWTLVIELIFYFMIFVFYKFHLLPYFNRIVFILILFVIIGYNYKEYYWIDKLLDGLPMLVYLPLFFVGTIFYNVYKIPMQFKHYGLVLFCLSSQLYLFKFTNNRIGYINQEEYNVMITLYFIVFVFFVKDKIKIISIKPLLFFGEISYSLYLIHQFLSIDILIPFFMNTLNLNFWVSSFILTLPLIIIIAYLITVYIERPIGKLIKAKLIYRKLDMSQ